MAQHYPESVPKLCGSDVELANFITGCDDLHGTGRAASRLLLEEIDGFAHSAWSKYYSRSATGSAGQFNAQDQGRKFLSGNGGSAYIDLDHLEIPLPEVRSARDYVAAWHAMLRIARGAMERADDRLQEGLRMQVLVNNSDGLGHSYGSHLNLLITRRAYDNIFQRKLHHLLYLAAYQVSSIIFTGLGKVGAENKRPAVDYQISQRADFFETLTGIQTTFNRPLVNSRDEALCGSSSAGSGLSLGDRYARLHVIFYDSNLCHVASFLKIGVLQLILAMLEQEHLNPNLLLDDPVSAVRLYSRDPDLKATARLANRQRRTATELQLCFLEEAQAFVAAGRAEGIVPEAQQIIEQWGRVLEQLHAGRAGELAGSLDWVLKRQLLERTLGARPELNWQSPQLKHLDHIYSSLDPADGLYWACEAAGLTERVVSDGEIERLVYEPPADTRAWGRAMLLRAAGPERVSLIDWDQIRFALTEVRGWPTYRTLHMPDPLGMTCEALQPLLEKADSLEELLCLLPTFDGSEVSSTRGSQTSSSASARTIRAGEDGGKVVNVVTGTSGEVKTISEN